MAQTKKQTEERWTVDSIAEKVGLKGLCEMFGWQGGTIHQAKEEIRRRLGNEGICPRKKDGVFCQLVIDNK